MLINGLSNFDAAVRSMPFGGSAAVGIIITGQLAGRLRVPLIYIIIVGAMLQVVGFGLLATLDESVRIEPRIYGYEVIAGLGTSFSFTSSLILVPLTVEKRDGGKSTIPRPKIR